MLLPGTVKWTGVGEVFMAILEMVEEASGDNIITTKQSTKSKPTAI